MVFDFFGSSLQTLLQVTRKEALPHLDALNFPSVSLLYELMAVTGILAGSCVSIYILVIF